MLGDPALLSQEISRKTMRRTGAFIILREQCVWDREECVCKLRKPMKHWSLYLSLGKLLFISNRDKVRSRETLNVLLQW